MLSTSDLCRRVGEVASRVQDRSAIAGLGEEISYRELWQRSAALAASLRAHGVGPDVRVGICMQRSPWMMISVLAVLRAGGCYVPLDPAYPAERLNFMIAEAGLVVLLGDEESLGGIEVPEGLTVLMPGGYSEEAACGAEEMPAADDLAYVVFTSGSTGKPKGVAMTHACLRNLVWWQCEVSTPGTWRTLQFSSLSFDASFQEIFSTWCVGGCLVVVDEATRLDPRRLLRNIDANRVERLFMPFAGLQQLAEAAKSLPSVPADLRLVLTAGEQLRVTPEIVDLFERLTNCRLDNMYGPSETHVVSALVLDGSPRAWPSLPSIGVAIDNVLLYVLDEDLKPVEPGGVGEIYGGGVAVARGYLDRPEITAERFLPDPFAGDPAARMYKTGDVGQFREDGQLHFLGRVDDQVKIRGFRIEVGEVEAVLSEHPDVLHNAVTTREGPGGVRQLVAYIVRQDPGLSAGTLRAHMRTRVPDYMTPSHFLFVDSLPLTPSGKINRRALPEFEDRTAQSPPDSLGALPGDLEEIVAQAWQEVLGLDSVPHDVPFFEMGGHSLLFARMQTVLEKALQREVAVLDFLLHPTVRGLSEYLRSTDHPDRPVPRPVAATATSSGIAVVGMAGRFPGAESVDAFWESLCRGEEGIQRFSDDELEAPKPADCPGDAFVKARGILADCEMFDAELFGYTPREAELMDPQHRVLLDTAWQALDHAGCDPQRFGGAIGLYAGCSLGTYLYANVLSAPGQGASLAQQYQVTGHPTVNGNDKDFLATKISYKLNLRGPSVTIQTACSTSLVAVIQAVQSLRLGQCDLALAGGVSITFPQKRGHAYVDGGMASADGHCRPFDAHADGTVFGAGAALVVLKRVEDAIRDGDTLYAVIRGAGLSNDGDDKAGYMAPSAAGQAAAIASAHRQAGISADTISYVEGHGTATPLGDPIEVEGLTRAFRETTAEQRYCWLGSVKGNVGHLEVASGVTGLIKTALALHHRKIPATLHYQQPNPLLDLDATPFKIVQELTEWPSIEGNPRRAGVSSFGVGGTNAHVVLEEAPPMCRADGSGGWQLLPLSAGSEAALRDGRRQLATALEQKDPVCLEDVAYTLQTGRRELPVRAFVVSQSREAAVAALKEDSHHRAVASGRPHLCMMFPGQGVQHVGMGQALYRRETLFRETIDHCAELVESLTGEDLRSWIGHDDRPSPGSADQPDQAFVAQTAVFAVDYAVARLWMHWGITPQAMIGHSLGEYVAACVAGVFSADAAVELLVHRGRLIQSMPRGAMLAVALSPEAVGERLSDDVGIAVANSPGSTVVSGPEPAIQVLQDQLKKERVASRRLAVSHAMHSAMLAPIVAPLRARFEAVALQAPSIPYVSTLTGEWITEREATDPGYWARQLVEPVVFDRGLGTLLALADPLLLEAGPNQALSAFARRHPDANLAADIVCSLPHAQSGADAQATLLHAAGTLWTHGMSMDWAGIHDPRCLRKVALPAYPFQRKRFWIEPWSGPASAQEISTASPSAERAGPGAEPVPVGEDTAPVGGEDALPALQLELANVVSDLSGIAADAIDPTLTFLELGFDSLFLTQVSLALQRRYGVRVTLRSLLDECSSLEALASFVILHRAEAAETGASSPLQGGTASPRDTGSRQGASGAALEDVTDSRLAPRTATHQPLSPSAVQLTYLGDFSARYEQRTRTSKAQAQQHRSYLADPRTVAGFDPLWKEITYPIVTNRSAGARLWDLDGNEYIDLALGFGSAFFGHGPDFIQDAIRNQLDQGIEIGPQTPLAGEVASLFCKLTGMERVTFANTGSEAVLGALRVARTVTGRDKIVMFSGAYHGITDEVLARGIGAGSSARSLAAAPGIPQGKLDNIIVLPYGEPSSLDAIRAAAGELAAVLVEPVQSRHPDLQPRAFLQELRALTETLDVALIFDEVITGFRVHPGGAQAQFGVKADLATYGKVVGGGLPIGIIAGRATYMDTFDGGPWRYGDDSQPEAGVTYFAGTFVRHPMAMAAAKAVLQRIDAEGPALQERLNRLNRRMVGELNDQYRRLGVPLHVESFASVNYLMSTEDLRFFPLIHALLRHRGIHIWDMRPFFLSTAHTEADVDTFVKAMGETIEDLQRATLLPGPPRTELRAASGFAPAGGEEGRLLPLAEAQKEIWLACQMSAQASCSYNESATLTLHGTLERDALHQSLKGLVGRHEALRITFASDGEHQLVGPPWIPDLPFLDLSDQPAGDQIALLQERVRQDMATPFDLTSGPLLRSLLVRTQPDVHLLVLTVHHLVCDGWSYDILIRDLSLLYSKEVAPQGESLPVPVQFSTYLDWLHAHERSNTGMEAESYWLTLYDSTESLHADLPLDFARPAIKTYAGSRDTMQICQRVYDAAQNLSHRYNCTLYSTLFSVFSVLVHRLSEKRDFVIGIPAAGQTQLDSLGLVGHCTNLLPLRITIEPDMPFHDVLAQVRTAVLSGFEHQSFTFGSLIRKLNPPRAAGRTPLVDVMFNLDPKLTGLQFQGLEVDIAANRRTAYQFDLGFNLVAGETLVLECDFNTDLYRSETMHRWMGYFERILEHVAAHPDTPVQEVNLLGHDDRARILDQWNETTTDYPRDTCIHDLIRQQARDAPDRVAMESAGRTVTYRELDEQSNRCATWLLEHGAGPGALVGLLLARSENMIVAMLGVLKAGAAYLPLDPTYPPERLRFMLEDSEARLILCSTGTAAPELAPLVETTPLDDVLKGERIPEEAVSVSPSHIAYVIYTSGSTGRPKGVQIEHRSVVNFLVSMMQEPGLGPDDRLLAITTLSFDISILELLLPLLVGGTVIIASDEVVADPWQLMELMSATRPTVMQGTPSTWRMLVDAGWKGDPNLKVLSGGEPIRPELAERLLAQSEEVWNLYGPTETTIWSTACRLRSGERISIGRPIANTRIYILDRNRLPVGVGQSGDLWIGGDGLARGYLGKPELTAERFVDIAIDGGQTERLYQTGDLARYNADGSIDCLGRTDHQVKIRGFRIELEEIEAAIRSHGNVREAIVVPAITEAGTDQLVAYVVPEGTSEEQTHWAAVWEDIFDEALQESRRLPDNLANIDSVIVGWAYDARDHEFAGEQVREWIEGTVHRIRALEPKRILEIGCGTGQLLLRLAPECHEYWGTDVASTAIAHLQEHISTRQDKLGHVALFQRPATQFSDLPRDHFDVVVINSVTQYFPGEDYLQEVLRGAVDCTAPGGRLFVGDVQSHALLRCHYVNEQVLNADDRTETQTLRSLADHAVAQERELVIDPEFFASVVRADSRVSAVQVSLRRGKIHNEATRFHYDVVLHVDMGESNSPPLVEMHWGENCRDLTELKGRLEAGDSDCLLVRGVPNARLSKAWAALQFVESAEPGSLVADVRAHLEQVDTGIDPEDLWDLGERHGYRVNVAWHATSQEHLVDAVFAKNGQSLHPPTPAGDTSPTPLPDRPSRWVNTPRDPDATDKLLHRIGKSLQEQLPAYMVPSRMVPVTELPLTPNGKIDRKALAECSELDRDRDLRFIPPRSTAETTIAEIWLEVLGLERVGIRDDFFELGGHSLSAVKAFAAIEDRLGQRLPLVELFRAPTIEELAKLVEERMSSSPGWRPLVPIRTDGDKPPFFCVHGAGGNVLLYRSLARFLGDDIPFFGLQARGLDGLELPLTTIEDMARCYVEGIRTVQASGPYHLGGYCMGGTVAYEMARVLREQGEEVGLVVLMDTYNFSAVPASDSVWGRAATYVEKARFHWRNLIQLDPDNRGRYLAEKWRMLREWMALNRMTRLRDRGSAGGENGLQVTGRTIQQTHDLAAAGYQPKPYDGRITLIKPHRNYTVFADPDMGWRGLVADTDIVEIPVNPHAMLVEPFVRDLASAIRERIGGTKDSDKCRSKQPGEKRKQQAPELLGKEAK